MGSNLANCTATGVSLGELTCYILDAWHAYL